MYGEDDKHYTGRGSMKFKALLFASALFGLPLSLFYSYKLLEHVKATEILWFIWILLIHISFATIIFSKLSEWEE